MMFGLRDGPHRRKVTECLTLRFPPNYTIDTLGAHDLPCSNSWDKLLILPQALSDRGGL